MKEPLLGASETAGPGAREPIGAECEGGRKYLLSFSSESDAVTMLTAECELVVGFATGAAAGADTTPFTLEQQKTFFYYTGCNMSL